LSEKRKSFCTGIYKMTIMIFELNALGSGQLPTEQITVQFIKNKKNLLRTFRSLGFIQRILCNTILSAVFYWKEAVAINYHCYGNFGPMVLYSRFKNRQLSHSERFFRNSIERETVRRTQVS